jgi:hypothetical protein
MQYGSGCAASRANTGESRSRHWRIGVGSYSRGAGVQIVILNKALHIG